MTNKTDKHWRLTATIDTALCIGDSGAGESLADKTTVKTSDGKLYIPASTLKGIWRHACEAIAQGKGDHVCDSPRAESMCVKNHCSICQIFGSPTLESNIFINDLIHDSDKGIKTTDIRSGVSINRNRRVAEDGRLYFTETSLPNAGFEFSGDITISSGITTKQIALLSAGLNYIHAVGAGKTRGLGWVSITKEDTTPVASSHQNINVDTEPYTELSIQVKLESPMITGGRKPTGQAVEAINYIRGGLIRGAVAKALLTDLESNEPDADFRQLFLDNNAGLFRNCYPGNKILPATAIGCKDSSGFRTADDDDKHGIFDTLIERIVSEKAEKMFQPTCPQCCGRVEAQGGFYTKSNDKYIKKTLNTRLLTRVAINRQRKVAEEGLLYHHTAIDPIITKEKNGIETHKKVVLNGSARIPSSLVEKVAETLRNKVNRLGGSGSRGLGRVSVNVENQEPFDSVKQRIKDFNTGLKKVWDTYSELPNIEIGQLDGTFFSVNLQSDAILTAEDGWQRTMVLTTRSLQEMADCNAEVSFVRSFASYGYVGGWNAAWGLPKETELVTNLGSVFVFHTSDVDAWLPALQQLENIGIGNRREEGFGQILICDPFHLHTREKLNQK